MPTTAALLVPDAARFAVILRERRIRSLTAQIRVVAVVALPLFFLLGLGSRSAVVVLGLCLSLPMNAPFVVGWFVRIFVVPPEGEAAEIAARAHDLEAMSSTSTVVLAGLVPLAVTIAALPVPFLNLVVACLVVPGIWIQPFLWIAAAISGRSWASAGCVDLDRRMRVGGFLILFAIVAVGTLLLALLDNAMTAAVCGGSALGHLLCYQVGAVAARRRILRERAELVPALAA